MPLDVATLLSASGSADLPKLIEAINLFTESEIRTTKAKEAELAVRQHEIEVELGRQRLEAERLQIEQARNRIADEQVTKTQALHDVVVSFMTLYRQEHHIPLENALKGVDARLGGVDSQLMIILQFLTLAMPIIFTQEQNLAMTRKLESLLRDAIKTPNAPPTVNVGGQHTVIDAERDVAGVTVAGKENRS